MKTILATIVMLFATMAIAIDETNTIVTAKVTAHRMSGAGCMDGVGGVYFYRTDLVASAPTNFAGVTLSTETVVSSPPLSQTNAVVRVRVPTELLTRARDQRQPCGFLLSQMIINTESNQAPEVTARKLAEPQR